MASILHGANSLLAMMNKGHTRFSSVVEDNVFKTFNLSPDGNSLKGTTADVVLQQLQELHGKKS